MRPLSEATSRIAGQSFSKKYIALGRIVSHWDDILGQDLASKAQPCRLLYRKQTTRRKRQDVTLEIACASADAIVLHYQKDLILERINQIFGERWITAIRFVPSAANTPPLRRQKRQKPLTVQEKNTLSGLLNYVDDHDMRGHLERLGQAIIMEDK